MPDRDLPYCETTKRTLSSFYLLLTWLRLSIGNVLLLIFKSLRKEVSQLSTQAERKKEHLKMLY